MHTFLFLSTHTCLCDMHSITEKQSSHLARWSELLCRTASFGRCLLRCLTLFLASLLPDGLAPSTLNASRRAPPLKALPVIEPKLDE